jgi:hypothetical protein
LSEGVSSGLSSVGSAISGGVSWVGRKVRR